MPPFYCRWVELFSGCVWFLWSLYVALMPAAFGGIIQWRTVARVGDNYTWAALIGVFSLAQAVAATLDRVMWRFAATSGMFVCCVAITDGLLASHDVVVGQGVVLYGAWIAAQLFCLCWMLRRRKT